MRALLCIAVVSVMISFAFQLPVMRMKLCVASNNPYKLQNQCVYCHNKQFTRTVRICTGTPYLPANVTIEEGYCMVRQCRTQMPGLRPEPYFANQNGIDSIGINVDDPTYNPAGYNVHSPVQGGFPPNIPLKPNQFNQFNQRRRPPAQVFVGQPLRPSRPFFGKRSIRDDLPDIDLNVVHGDDLEKNFWDMLYNQLAKRTHGPITLAIYAGNTTHH